jgi:signal transduction histidine kinase
VSVPNLSDTNELFFPPAPRVLPGSGLAGATVVVGVGLACFLAQWLSVMLWVPPTQLSTVWVSGGLMLAVALLTDPRQWPAVITAAMAGQTLLFVTLGLVQPAAAIFLGLLAGLQTVAVASVLRAVLRRPLSLSTRQEFVSYLGVAVVGGALAASILFVAGAWGMRYRPATFLVWRTFALSALLGYLTMTPTVVLLVQKLETIRRASARRRLEAALLGLLLALAAGFVFTGAENRSASWPAFMITLPPLLLWSAMRFGALGASASLLFVTLISTLGTARGLGPFISETPGANTLSLQLFMLGTGLPLFGLAVLLGEQERAAAAVQSSQVRLRKLNRDLLVAREEEGTRIARELHDDVGQRLSLVSVGLSRLRRAYAEAAPGSGQDIMRLQEQTTSIVRSLRELSHQLHPAALEHVGLASALELTCDEVRQATGLGVHLVNHADTSAIPRDIALCLFRVVQEALNNVIRHSGARGVDLSLRREGTTLLLQITDDGRGFTPCALEAGSGLGLYSVTERVRAVGGATTVDSAPGAGTTLRVAVPLEETHDT